MTHPTDDSLKPCPFCGSPAEYDDEIPLMVSVQCTQCECMTNGHGDHEEAARTWNKRAEIRSEEISLLNAPAPLLKAEQADLIDYLKGVYAFLESTSPAGFAEEAFRLPPSATRNQRSLFDAITGDTSGELSPVAGQDSNAGEPAGRIAGVEAEQAKDAAEDAELLERAFVALDNYRAAIHYAQDKAALMSAIKAADSEAGLVMSAIRAARAAERKA